MLLPNGSDITRKDCSDSVCEHGNTQTLVQNIRPLLEKYNAHYMSGHDHCAQHFLHNGVNYFLNGMGNSCCYENSKMGDAPKDSLKYLMANTGSGSDGGGVDGTIGGFTSVEANADGMTVKYINQDGKVLYTTTVSPRTSASKNVGHDFADPSGYDRDARGHRRTALALTLSLLSISIAAVVLLSAFYNISAESGTPSYRRALIAHDVDEPCEHTTGGPIPMVSERESETKEAM